MMYAKSQHCYNNLFIQYPVSKRQERITRTHECTNGRMRISMRKTAGSKKYFYPVLQFGTPPRYLCRKFL